LRHWIIVNNGSQIYTGGIFGCQYWGGSVYTTSISKCTAQITLEAKGIATSSNPIRYGGLFGYSIPYQNDSQLNSIICIRCGFHVKVKPFADALGIIVGGLTNNVTTTAMGGRTSFTECYAVVELDGQGFTEDNIHIDGISRTNTYLITRCFFDREKLEATYTRYENNYVYAGTGITTEQMKSRDFLASQGWSI